MYWNISKILPYQRHFNFINGPREIGKTYSTLKWLIGRAINKGEEFVYICRTQDEKKNGVLKYALEKVMQQEYQITKYSGDTFVSKVEDKPIARCIALSEYMKIKKFSFPNTKYFIFDEYMLESSDSSAYVHGWQEPDLLLSIYQTIDRGRDILTGFLLGNNTSFYNPYHLHEAFNIPFVQPGKIWTSQNVLFQWALPSKELKNHLQGNAFNQMIQNTTYDKYAVQGHYINENDVFLGKLDSSCKYYFTIRYNAYSYGVFMSSKQGVCIISDKIDNSCIYDYALTLPDHTQNTLLLSRNTPHIKWLADLYKKGVVRFTSMPVKQKFQDILRIIVR